MEIIFLSNGPVAFLNLSVQANRMFFRIHSIGSGSIQRDSIYSLIDETETRIVCVPT